LDLRLSATSLLIASGRPGDRLAADAEESTPAPSTAQQEADLLLAQWQANRVLPPHLTLEGDR
jgi:hypothetical protein